jgi:hypothetical protein
VSPSIALLDGTLFMQNSLYRDDAVCIAASFSYGLSDYLITNQRYALRANKVASVGEEHAGCRGTCVAELTTTLRARCRANRVNWKML